MLLHGVTASAAIWWRVGPALAATGRRVVAPDLPGHGLTGHWAGHHRFRDNAADVAAWIRAAGLDVPEVQIVGHSWGAMTAAALPRVGIRPATLVLLDPPAVPLSIIARMANDPAEVPGPDLAATIADLAARNPAWSAPDVRAKAEALLQLDVAAARAIVLENGDWDGGPDRSVRSVLGRDPDVDRPGRPGRRRLPAGRDAAGPRRAGRRGPHPDLGGRAARTAAALPRSDDARPPAGARLIAQRGRLSAVRRRSSIARSYAST